MSQVTSIPLGYNTVYLWEGLGDCVLIDTGPDYEGSWDALWQALGPKRPDLVVATHGHLDHSGLGRRWQSEGVPVAVGKADARLVRGHQYLQDAEFHALEDYARASGAPPDMADKLLAELAAARTRHANLALPGYRPLTRGSRYPTALRMDPFEPQHLLDGDTALPGGLQVLSVPGHTRGNLVLWDAAEGWLFSGDQLLEDITPTPGLQWIPEAERAQRPDANCRGDATCWRFRSLPAFTAALERLAKLGPSRCFPGHGSPFGGVRELILANLMVIEARTERVRKLRGEVDSLFDLCERLYPRAARRRLLQIMATVQGHLDLLEAERLGD